MIKINENKTIEIFKISISFFSTFIKANKKIEMKKIKLIIRLKLLSPNLKISSPIRLEINIKISQGCSEIFYSRLFKTSYSNKKSFLGLVKYNLMRNMLKRNLTPLGGIKLTNINKLKSVRCNSIAIMSEIKKKPAIISRLF